MRIVLFVLAAVQTVIALFSLLAFARGGSDIPVIMLATTLVGISVCAGALKE